MKLALALISIVALAVLAPSASAADERWSPNVTVTLYTNYTVGYSTTADGAFTDPGPTFSMWDNQTMTFYLYAADDQDHAFYLDMNGNHIPDDGDLTGSTSYWRGSYSVITLPSMAAGTYTYRDATFQGGAWVDSDISGTLRVDATPKPWWRWDPFWIFGLFISIAIIGWIGFIGFHGIKMWRMRKKLRQTSPEIHRWLKAIMDPDSPTRPTPEYVANIRLGKKKIKAQQEKERKKDGNGADTFALPKIYRFPRLHRKRGQ